MTIFLSQGLLFFDNIKILKIERDKFKKKISKIFSKECQKNNLTLRLVFEAFESIKVKIMKKIPRIGVKKYFWQEKRITNEFRLEIICNFIILYYDLDNYNQLPLFMYFKLFVMNIALDIDEKCDYQQNNL